MQDFKQKIKGGIRGTLFFLILLFLFLGMSSYINKLSIKSDNLIQDRNKSIVKIQKEPEQTIDALILGDSESYCSFSPMKMWEDQGITSFVCGQAGQKIQETYYMLKTAFETQSPRVVILETNTIFRGQGRAEGVKEILAEKGNYYFPIFRFHNVWKALLLGTQYVEENYKGFALRDTIDSYDGSEEYMKAAEGKAEIPEIVSVYMEQILSLCSENGAELLLVSAPSPVNYNYEKHNALQEFANQKNIAYLDLNLMTRDLQINWKEDSLDKGDHLNFLGAHKVSGYVGEYLKNKYQLPDHREDAGYDAWKKEAGKYKASVKARGKMLRKTNFYKKGKI